MCTTTNSTWLSAQKDTELAKLQTDALEELFKRGFSSELTYKEKRLEYGQCESD